VILGAATSETIGNHAGAGHRLCHDAAGDRRPTRALGFLATAPVAVPGIVLGVGLFLSYTRPPFVLYGTLWILLIAFLTINLPVVPISNCRRRFATIHPELEDAMPHSRRHTAAVAAPNHRARLLRTGVIATWCFICIGRDARAFRGDHSVHSRRPRCCRSLIYDLNESGDPRRHLGFGHRHAGHHLRGGASPSTRFPVFGANPRRAIA